MAHGAAATHVRKVGASRDRTSLAAKANADLIVGSGPPQGEAPRRDGPPQPPQPPRPQDDNRRDGPGAPAGPRDGGPQAWQQHRHPALLPTGRVAVRTTWRSRAESTRWRAATSVPARVQNGPRFAERGGFGPRPPMGGGPDFRRDGRDGGERFANQGGFGPRPPMGGGPDFRRDGRDGGERFAHQGGFGPRPPMGGGPDFRRDGRDGGDRFANQGGFGPTPADGRRPRLPSRWSRRWRALRPAWRIRSGSSLRRTSAMAIAPSSLPSPGARWRIRHCARPPNAVMVAA